MLYEITLEDGRQITVMAHRMGRALDFIDSDVEIESVEGN